MYLLLGLRLLRLLLALLPHLIRLVLENNGIRRGQVLRVVIPKMSPVQHNLQTKKAIK